MKEQTIEVGGFGYILEPEQKIIGLIVETSEDFSFILKPCPTTEKISKHFQEEEYSHNIS